MANEVDDPQPEEDPLAKPPRTDPPPGRDSSNTPAPHQGPDAGSGVMSAAHQDVEVFPGLRIPEPAPPDPDTPPRVLAFVSILVGGLLGGLIGYGIGDLLWAETLPVAVLTLIGALVGSVGVGVLANLTLRAMGEWNAVEHPEAEK